MPITPGIQIIPFSPGARACAWTRVGLSFVYLKFADTLDANGNIINPVNDITDDTRQVFSRGWLPASAVGLRARYTHKGYPGPIVKLFGRTRLADGSLPPGGGWQILKSRLFETSVLLRTDESDALNPPDEEGFATSADTFEQFFPVQGCNEFLVGVERAMVGQAQAALDAAFV